MVSPGVFVDGTSGSRTHVDPAWVGSRSYATRGQSLIGFDCAVLAHQATGRDASDLGVDLH